jgi:hypothetical protein
LFEIVLLTCAEEAKAKNIWFRGLLIAYVIIKISARTEYRAADSIMMAVSER